MNEEGSDRNGATTLIRTTFSVTTLRIIHLNDTQRHGNLCCYSLCRVSTAMLSVVMLNVVMPSVVAP